MLTGDDLAYATLDYIREHPESWDQGFWFCGSNACFAGTAASLMSDEPVKEWDKISRVRGPRMDGVPVPPAIDLARQALGWTTTQARYVFFSCYTNNYSELELRVKKVLNGEIG